MGEDTTKIKSDALRLLSFRPRSEKELRQRLKLKKHPAPLIEEVLDLLKRQGMLDDAKFAKLYAESRVYSRPAGKKNLELDLQRKGLPKDLIEKTIAGIQDYDEKKIARDLVFRRFQKMTGLSKEKKKARIFGFLKRRGFQTDVIFSVMSELFKDDEVSHG